MTQERILIADGDIALSALLKSRLESMGYLVDCARTAKEALDVLKTRWVDLVLLDIALKGEVNGFQLFKKMRTKKEFLKIPVVVQSSKVGMKKIFEMMGAETFFIKPYSVDMLMSEVRDILQEKILVYGDRSRETDSVVKSLGKYDIILDVLRTRHNFYYNVITHRYKLVVVQYKWRPNMTDRMLSIVRGSSKNKEVPVIVYVTTKISELDAGEIRKIHSLKEMCDNLGACDFMDKGYSSKQFVKLSGKYLES
ncbi:MAG: response regulator [Candidatus Omnitrophica bacterium]|nr:response regulator [Candidatus Omnitrophota bacterium]MBU1127911.1 response regulator [Candidatus Omnitrophota bacterium]MBU1784595.1 response regulator [Candidatus Omnitrophota bacterium]MBU1850910.1 response regulator [Candidatus Omnitrophota bacterium]